MNYKHWIALIVPYLVAAAAGAAQLASKSPKQEVAIAGLIILAAFSHRNLFATPPVAKADK